MKTILITLLFSPILSVCQISGVLDVKFLSSIEQVKVAMAKKGAKIDIKNTNTSEGVYTYSGLNIGGFSSTTTIFRFVAKEMVMASVIFLPDSEPEGVEMYNNLQYGLIKLYGSGTDLTKITYPYDNQDREKIVAIKSGYVKLQHEWDDGDKFIGRIELSLNKDLFPVIVYQHRPTMVDIQMQKERVKTF